MKLTDEQFRRILEAASKATPPADDTLSWTVRAKVLAEWRQSREGVDRDWEAVRRMFRFGLGCALAVALAIAAFEWRDLSDMRAAAYVSTDANINIALAQ